MDKAKLKASFKKHTSEPDISIDEYVRRRRIELGRNVTQRKLIYLDIKYWIILRDVLLGCRNEASSMRLLEYLRLRVQKNEVICPISSSVFVELLKQQDPGTRQKTAELIDELSLGVTLISEDERVETELNHFFYSYDVNDFVNPLKWQIWSNVSFVFGVLIPPKTGFRPDIELVIQKVYFDQMWDRSLTEILDTLKDSQPPESDFKALAARLNEGNAGHASEIQSFKQAYEREIEGVLSLSADLKEHDPQHFSLFMQSFRKTPEIAKLLPTLYLYARCHASVRWNKTQKLKGNDIYDFQHAVAAVPYCDVFLTENPLQALLTQNHMEINKDFSCRIISSVSEAVRLLEIL